MTIIFVAGLIALLLTITLGTPYLDLLKKKMMGQYVREDVPENHSQKAGTPTMGGVLIVMPAIIASVLGLYMAEKISAIAIMTLITIALYCYAGYQDDIKKITKKQNEGLTPRWKLTLQIIVALLPAIYMLYVHKTSINIFNLWDIELGWFYPIFAMFIIIGSSNAVNLTDGLDGLATGTSVFAFISLAILAYLNGYETLSMISTTIAGSCLGFLYFNKHPAKLFMGDTGSLALGGALGTLAILSKNEFWLIFIGIIFIIETLSVIIQVTSFKTTGKRVFKMSPIHHHFELCGWSEVKIVNVFWAISFICCLICLLIRFYMV